jgi:ubiquinone/menaquinone biosynthesis C-methylase UbiE
MSSTLPAPPEIKDFYDRKLREIGGEYIQYRWGNTEIQRRHFRQTYGSVSAVLESHQPRGHVLEIGAGPAVWTELYIGGVEKLTLLDISAEMLNAAKTRIDSWSGGAYANRVNYICGDANQAVLPPASFDAIVTIRAFEYFSDKVQFLQQCERMLKPNGLLILGTKNAEWEDSIQERRKSLGHSATRAPVDSAMQTDLVSPLQLLSMTEQAGLSHLYSHPLVFGSYRRRYRLPGSLWYFDMLHRRHATHSMNPGLSRLVESFVLVAQKPGPHAS